MAVSTSYTTDTPGPAEVDLRLDHGTITIRVSRSVEVATAILTSRAANPARLNQLTAHSKIITLGPRLVLDLSTDAADWNGVAVEPSTTPAAPEVANTVINTAGVVHGIQAGNITGGVRIGTAALPDGAPLVRPHAPATTVLEAPEPHSLFDVVLTVPPGSRVQVHTTTADVIATGELERLAVNTRTGNIITEAVMMLIACTTRGSVTAAPKYADITTSVGPVILHGTVSRALISTRSADITVDKVRARADLNTVTGDIRFSMLREATVNARTTTGDIHLTTPTDAHSNPDVHTLRGQVHHTTRGDL